MGLRRGLIMKSILMAFLAGGFAASTALAQAEYFEAPDPAHAPGAINKKVTQSNIKRTICNPAWVVKTQAAAAKNAKLLPRQLKDRGYGSQDPAKYVPDHLIPIEVGGHPSDARNLWPQAVGAGWNAAAKDKLEVYVNREVCAGHMKLAEAQAVFKKNWVEVFHLYCGGAPDAACLPPGTPVQLENPQ
jgi:hypothetical protein